MSYTLAKTGETYRPSLSATNFLILFSVLALSACDSSRPADGDSDAVVFIAGNPPVLGEFPSDGILGLPDGSSSVPSTGGESGSIGDTSGNTDGVTGGDTGTGSIGDSSGSTDGVTGGNSGTDSAGGIDGGGTSDGSADAGLDSGAGTAGSTGGNSTGGSSDGTGSGGTDTGGTGTGNTTVGLTDVGSDSGADGGSTSGQQTGGQSSATAGNSTAGSSTTGADAGDTGGSSNTTGGGSAGDGFAGDGGSNPIDPSTLPQVLVVTDQMVDTIELTGVSVDQPFQQAQSDYTASVGFLQSSTSVLINGQAVAELAIDEPGVLLVVENTDGSQRYSFAISQQSLQQFAEQGYIKDPSGRQNSEFGTAVAISGDHMAVLGRSEENRVSLYRRNGGQWSLETVLQVPGDSLDLDRNLLAIGDESADGRDFEGLGFGAVHVYRYESGGWNFVDMLQAASPGEADQFGHAVAVYGDTVVVGAPGENSSATGINGNANDESALDAGAVYVFVEQSGQWQQQAYLKGAATNGGDKFGTSVDLLSDRLAVGAIGEESGSSGNSANQNDESLFAAGAAYIFQRNQGGWSQTGYIKPEVPGSSDLFGTTVALGSEWLAVGAPGEDSAATGLDGDASDNSLIGSGAVYVFGQQAGLWQQQAYLKASNSNDSDGFGSALAMQGNTLIAGASGEDSNARGVNGDQQNNLSNNAGAVYVFKRGSTEWMQVLYLHSSNSDAGDQFSAAAALALDQGTLVVGAPGESSASRQSDVNAGDNSMPRAGAGYVFR